MARKAAFMPDSHVVAVSRRTNSVSCARRADTPCGDPQSLSTSTEKVGLSHRYVFTSIAPSRIRKRGVESLDIIVDGVRVASSLLWNLDREVISITVLTLRVSLSATLFAVAIGVPLGTLLALTNFPGRKLVISLFNLGMGLPPVVVGLWVSIFLWRYGPLGMLGLMYTPSAMIIAQSVIASPIVISLTVAGIQQIDPKLRMQIVALGASWWQSLFLLLREARLYLLAAVMAGFGGVISEIGASMMVGGNIKGQTQILTTAIALNVSRGEFGYAIGLSIVLLALAYVVTLGLTSIQQRWHLK